MEDDPPEAEISPPDTEAVPRAVESPVCEVGIVETRSEVLVLISDGPSVHGSPPDVLVELALEPENSTLDVEGGLLRGEVSGDVMLENVHDPE